MISKLTLRTLLPLIVLTTSIGCANSQAVKKSTTEIFKISRDTIHVDIEGMLSAALLIDNKYYAFYAVRDSMSTNFIKKFYIIDKSGKIEREINVPKGIQNEYYFKLSYWHGQFLVNTELYKNTYDLDLSKGEFVKRAKYSKVPIYEDQNYEVSGDCRGEFGSTTYFKSKSTGATYSISSSCPSVINKLGDKYLINTSEIVKIEDTAKAGGRSAVTASELVTKNMVNENFFDPHFFIPTSFLANGILYHIYNSYKNDFSLDQKESVIIKKDTVKIAKITVNAFTTVYTLEDQIDISLQQQLSPDYQICTFHTEERHMTGFKADTPPYKEGKYGFIEIKGNEIKIHYFFSK